jgi:cytochrome c oxidase cbb3-type subunit 3
MRGLRLQRLRSRKNSWMASKYKILRLFTLVVGGVSSVALATAQVANVHGKSTTPVAQGKQILAANCAACHGIDGKGSERAPNIADTLHMRRISDGQLAHIIGNGIAGTGMPAFHSLSNSQVRELIAYLRSLEGASSAGKLPGNPQKGEAIFFGKADCSNCHMIAGKGGFIGSDLTEYAATHSVEQIHSAIVDSSPGDKQVRLATAVLRDGVKYTGRVRNEDNFSIQLESLDGTFHLIMKSELRKVDYDSQPLMPSNFGSSLTASELNDLISYLLSAAGNADPQKSAKDHEMDNLED